MEGKKNKSKIYVGLFIAFIMVSSIFGFVASYQSSSDPSFEYGDFTFYKSNKGYYTKLKNNKVYFQYAPDEIEDIELSKEAKDLLINSKVLSITYDPSSAYIKVLGGIQYNFDIIVHELLGIIVQRGLTNNTNYELEQITCEDATEFVPVIFFKEGEDIGYELKDNCIIASASDDRGFVRLYNRLLYGVLGIIE